MYKEHHNLSYRNNIRLDCRSHTDFKRQQNNRRDRIMTENVSQPTANEPTAEKRKRLSRSERIRRRRLLALQRREEKAQAVTAHR